jgi:hypothetical protein
VTIFPIGFHAAFVLRDQSFLCCSLAVSQPRAGTDLLCPVAYWLLPLSFITMITSHAPHAWWAIATAITSINTFKEL